MADVPRTADIVVVGGGVHGASVAYHLAHRRAGRVVLVERKFLASGPTGRSSALVRRFYAMDFLTRTGNASAHRFQRWSDEIGGGDPGFRQVGILWLAGADRAANLSENVRRARALGVRVDLLTPGEVKALVPAMAVDDLAVAAHEPESGYADAVLDDQCARRERPRARRHHRPARSGRGHPRGRRPRDRCPHGSGRDPRAGRGRLRGTLGAGASRAARHHRAGRSEAPPDVLLPASARLRRASRHDRPAEWHVHAARDGEPDDRRHLHLSGGGRSRPVQRGRRSPGGHPECRADRPSLPDHGARAVDGRATRGSTT